jgi:hypothetical protein
MTTRHILPVLILLGVFGVGLASASGAATQGLVGITVCCPNEFVQVDPATGALTTLSNVGDENFGFTSSPAVDPATHSFYIVRFPNASASPAMIPDVVTINTQTGALAESPPLATGIFALGFDSASSTLAGITVCCPNEFVQVDPATGALTTLSNVGDENFGFSSSTAVDPATHSFYIVRLSTDFQPHVVTINTQTGALAESPPLVKGIFALGFDPSVAPTPTPDSLKSAINGFLADGAIRNAGLAQSLLAKVKAAAGATAAGSCDAAANIYRAFIKEVRAQSGVGVAEAAAAFLISQAEFLATVPCP